MYSFNPHLGADLQANAVHYLFCQTSCLLVSNIQGEKMHIIDKSNNAFPIRLLCIAMATKRWNQPRWKHFQGWSLMAQIIAETYTSPKQTTSRINNVLSSLSSATSVHLSTGSPVSKTHANVLSDVSDPADLCSWDSSPLLQVCRPKQRKMYFCSSYLFEIHLEKVKTALCKWAFCFARLLGWYQIPSLGKQGSTRKVIPILQELTYKPCLPCSDNRHQPGRSTLAEHLPKVLSIKMRFFLLNWVPYWYGCETAIYLFFIKLYN